MSSIRDLFPDLPLSHAAEPVHITDRCTDWKLFLEEKYAKHLNTISRNYPKQHSVTIDYSKVLEWGELGCEMADEILSDPEKVIRDIKDAIKTHKLIKPPKKAPLDKLNVRIVNLPKSIRTAIRDIRTDHIEELVSIEGIVRKVNDVRPRVTRAVFRCPVGHTHIIEQGYGVMDIPDRCPTEGCNQRKLEMIHKASVFIDAQKARIQESPEGLPAGAQPQTLDCDITDDIAGVLTAGSRAVINGIVRTHQRISYGQKSTNFEIYLDTNSIELPDKEFSDISITAEDEEKILELAKDPNIHLKIRDSMAPSIFGSERIKEAISLQQFGGIAKEMPDGSVLRGDIHIMLIGDPGIAKSQFLKFISRISPRAIFTSGQSSSAAGLTATAVKDDFGEGRWTLEAGALVMADGGTACVDEMDKMNKQCQDSLLEAMEQQTVSVSKAGMNVSLKSRCNLLGAANPVHGRFSPLEPMAKQFNMNPALLSRFDLIFLVTDIPEKEYDTKLAEHILNSHKAGQEIARKGKASKKELSHLVPPIEINLLRKYIIYARKNCIPSISDEAFEMLKSYYTTVRGLGGDSQDKPVPITARQLEALVRLAEASAKSRLSQEITAFDASRVISIVDECLRGIAFDSPSGYDIGNITDGISKGQTDIKISVKQAIEALGGTPEESKVVELVVSRGFKEGTVSKRIEEMKRDGTLSEPRYGLLKVV